MEIKEVEIVKSNLEMHHWTKKQNRKLATHTVKDQLVGVKTTIDKCPNAPTGR